MIGVLMANGKSSEDFNIFVTDAGIYSIAERDVESITVPGRSGDLLIDNNRFLNASHTYPCVATKDFDENFSAFVGFLVMQKGYIKLIDSFHPEEYILGKYTGETNPQKVWRNDMGAFTLEFSRKPQRYFIDGDQPIEFTANGSLLNKYMPAKPLVRVYGTGQVGIGSAVITINSANVYTDIDCESMNAYKGSTNCNGNITLNNGTFWTLENGTNGVNLGNGISKVEITPRWWRL